MNKCQGLMGYFFGHNYEPVITKSSAKIPDRVTEIRGSMIDRFREETFHAMICKRCGHKLENK